MIKPKRITKKWRTQTAREIIDRNFLDVPFTSSDVTDFAFVCDAPITGAIRRKNPQYPKDTRHLHISMKGGQFEPTSWTKLINPIPAEQNAKRVMRNIISHDLRDFMEGFDFAECALCGAIEDLTVDHIDPPFDAISNEFIGLHGLPMLAKNSDPKKVVDMFADINLEAEWIAFHAARACYQILCRSCNASKGTK